MDIYKEVTDRIIEELEKGVIPWRKPWTGTSAGAISHTTGRAYSILNQMLLRQPGEYITYLQAKKEGGHVKKGAKSRIIVFWKQTIKDVTDENGQPVMNEDGTPKKRVIPCLKYYQVFHIDDCEGIKPKWEQAPRQTAEPDETAVETFYDYIRREGIRLEEEASDEAYYSPTRDVIHLPLINQFDEAAEYYSTAFHEATHSTGHVSRLARFTGSAAAAAFGSETYSKEELIAEIGSACILNEIGLETAGSFQNSAAYIQSWLKVLRNDKKMIVSAAGRAEKAVNLILNRQPEAPEAE